jgi:hypothetical protein
MARREPFYLNLQFGLQAVFQREIIDALRGGWTGWARLEPKGALSIENLRNNWINPGEQARRRGHAPRSPV